MSTKLTYTELFYSIQGEGRFSGVPSVFLRTFGCNFRCKGFGRTDDVSNEKHNPEVVQIIKDIDKYPTFNDLPLTHTGCDTYASIYPEFKRFAQTHTIDELVPLIKNLLPTKEWRLNNGNDIHLVITGGEPLLGWQRCYSELLGHPGMKDIINVTFETNGTQKLHEDFIDDYFTDHSHVKLTFSVSPKLSVSGEKWEDAIKPTIVSSYQAIGETYLKFVVEKEEDFAEVDKAVAEYRAAGFAGKVYVMPVGGVTGVYDKNKFNVADEALKRGYYYSPRLHIDLFGNAWAK